MRSVQAAPVWPWLAAAVLLLIVSAGPVLVDLAAGLGSPALAPARPHHDPRGHRPAALAPAWPRGGLEPVPVWPPIAGGPPVVTETPVVAGGAPCPAPCALLPR